MSTDNSLPYKALYELSLLLQHQDVGARRIMQTLLVKSGEIVDLKQGFLITFNKDDSVHGAYILSKNAEEDGKSSNLWELLLERGLIGFVYHGQRTVNIRNIKTDPRWPSLPDEAHFPTTGSAIGIPLHIGTGVFGVMVFLHHQVDYFSDHITSVLEEIAALGAMAINNAWDFDLSGNNIRYQILFDDAVVPMILTDLKGSIVSGNRKACEMLGYDQQQLTRKSITQVNPIDLSSIGSGGLNKLKPDEEVTFRSEAVSAKGEKIPVLLRLRRLAVGEANLVEWVEHDMSAQMALEQLRRDLTAMVYHDLRGPLQNISASITKLAQVLAGHENQAVRTLLQIGNQSSRQLRRMVDSLLDVQRLEESSAILDRRPVEIRVAVTDAVQLVQPLALDAGQKINLDVEQSLPMIHIDNDMIIRVMTNLLENAIKHAPTEGTITISARVGDSLVRIAVADSGPGIPAEHQAGIFDKFNRVKYRNAPQGVGLGLAFCRLAVNAHGGEIWVESKPGEGSQFIFTLPLVAEADDDDLITQLVTTA